MICIDKPYFYLRRAAQGMLGPAGDSNFYLRRAGQGNGKLLPDPNGPQLAK